MKGESLAFIHATTGERKAVTVEAFTRTMVTVRWGMAGLYELDVRDNTMRAYVQKTRRPQHRGVLPWRAEDIDAVRKMLDKHFGGDDKAKIAATIRHAKMDTPAVSGVDQVIERLRRSSTYGKS